MTRRPAHRAMPAAPLRLAAVLVLGMVAAPAGPAWAAESDLPETHPAVHFDRGIAAAEDERLGWAVLHFERARLRAPLDRNIEQALDAVRAEARRRQLGDAGVARLTGGEPAGLFAVRLLHSLPAALSGWLLLLAVWLLAGLGLLALRCKRGFARDLLWSGALVAAAVAALALAALVLGPWSLERHRPAVVVAAEVVARQAPDELAPRTRPSALYEGATVRLLEERPGWARIELSDGTTVWVRARAVEPLVPSAARRPAG